MIIKTKVEFVPLTRELAIRFAGMEPLPGEREKNPARTKFFQDLVKSGDFRYPVWSVAAIDGEDKEYRADGQHTSNVLAEMAPEDFPSDLMVTIYHFNIDKADTLKLFDMFDNPQSSRKNVDVMGVFRAEHKDLVGLPPSFLMKIASGIDFHEKSIAGAVTFKPRRHGYYFNREDARRFALWAYQWESSTHAINKWMLGRHGLVAEMFADFKAKEDLATAFWNEVMTELNSNEDVAAFIEAMRDLSSRPRITQDKFRAKAKKMWTRYVHLIAPKVGDVEMPEQVLMPPQQPQTGSELRA